MEMSFRDDCLGAVVVRWLRGTALVACNSRISYQCRFTVYCRTNRVLASDRAHIGYVRHASSSVHCVMDKD